ncbi:hypothetical protein Vretifemale_11040, partial [Volvox reticuliferus]
LQVSLGMDVQINFTRLVLKSFRKVPFFQSPGIDLVYDATNGRMQHSLSPPPLGAANGGGENVTNGGSDPQQQVSNTTHDISSTVVITSTIIEHAAVVHKICITVAETIKSVATAPRPPWEIGTTQQASPRVPSPNPDPCVNDTSRWDVRRCWSAVGLYVDIASMAYDRNGFDLQLQTSYVVRVIDAYYLCEMVMTEECVRRYDVLGCFKSMASLMVPPPPAPSVAKLGPVTQADDSSMPSTTSSTGTSSNNGGAGGSRKKQPLLAIVLTTVLLGTTTIVMVAMLILCIVIR